MNGSNHQIAGQIHEGNTLDRNGELVGTLKWKASGELTGMLDGNLISAVLDKRGTIPRFNVFRLPKLGRAQ